MVVDMDQVATDISYEMGGASSDLSHECIAFYAEVYRIVLFATKPVLVSAGICSSITLVSAVEFSETVRVRQTSYFNV